MFIYFAHHPENFWTLVSIVGRVLAALIFYYAGLMTMRWLDNRRRVTFHEKWFIRTIVGIAIIVGAIVGFKKEEVSAPVEHTPMRCEFKFGDITVQRCENDETVCYYSYYSQGNGLTCHWKTANEEYVVVAPNEHQMTCGLYNEENGLYHCDNKEVICYGFKKGGLSCAFRTKPPTRERENKMMVCSYYGIIDKMFRCENEEAVCFGAEHGISCKINQE